MSDLLVKLYELPEVKPLIDALRDEGIDIRRSIAPEKHLVLKWVGAHFGDHWVSETDVAFSNQPVSCWIATHDGECVGFACCDATAKAFFGPTGVDETYRGRGIGKALLLVCLHDLYARGYIYGIVGSAGPVDFYAKTVGAVEILDSSPGVYRGMLRGKRDE
ncbi:MAG: GNAT family N-acetyltransferase [Chloroflexi bacterium]|nr:GNAT family N-acetyltransferase [Chloroflexota bacterium]